MLIAECTSLARRIFPQFCCYRALTLRALRCPCLPQTFRRSVLAQRFRAFSICSKKFILHPSSDSALPRNQCWVYMAPGKTLGGCDNVWKNRVGAMLPSVCLPHTRHFAFHVSRAGCPWWWLMCVATQTTSYSGSCQLELRWCAQPPCSLVKDSTR